MLCQILFVSVVFLLHFGAAASSATIWVSACYEYFALSLMVTCISIYASAAPHFFKVDKLLDFGTFFNNFPPRWFFFLPSFQRIGRTA